MVKIKVLIVEDKLLVAEGIAAILTNNEMEVVQVCDTGEEALTVVETNTPDLILMDIELAGAMDGISTAQMIQQRHSIPVIYLSDFSDERTLHRAFKTLPKNYLTKPFKEDDLIRAINLAFATANAEQVSAAPSNKDHILIRKGTQSYVKIKMEEILYLEAERVYCDIVTAEQKYRMTTPLNHIHEQLAHPSLLRVSRSFVVNLDNVIGLEGNMIRLRNEKQVQMSKEYREAFMERQNVIK